MSLEDKLRQLAERKLGEETIDWPKERDAWVEALAAMYDQVQKWLADYVARGYVTIGAGDKEVAEDSIGRYQVTTLELDFSGRVVIFEPLGTLVFGAQGRVDVYRRDRRSRAVMLLLSNRDTRTWQFWTSRDPRDRLDFTRENLERVIETLLEV